MGAGLSGSVGQDMLTQSYPVSADGLALEVMIGLPGNAFAPLVAAGQPVPAPILVRALIDTGSDVTCVAIRIPQQFGLIPIGPSKTQTVSGSLPVNLYEVSLSIPGVSAVTGPLLVLPQLLVMELAQTLQNVDVLIGLDVLLQCVLHVDGPGRQFSLSA